mmetsp:Transcript_16577/g.25896  ORF Transcript_16577/g.25896 Transcript_16577/m.25896 type:complete len:112 (+) Transcript_16577:246-581(+)
MRALVRYIATSTHAFNRHFCCWSFSSPTHELMLYRDLQHSHKPARTYLDMNSSYGCQKVVSDHKCEKITEQHPSEGPTLLPHLKEIMNSSITSKTLRSYSNRREHQNSCQL